MPQLTFAFGAAEHNAETQSSGAKWGMISIVKNMYLPVEVPAEINACCTANDLHQLLRDPMCCSRMLLVVLPHHAAECQVAPFNVP